MYIFMGKPHIFQTIRNSFTFGTGDFFVCKILIADCYTESGFIKSEALQFDPMKILFFCSRFGLQVVDNELMREF